uniref:MurR/RpiR family transcriptional regulator n=1 Tax=Streptococcus merionis TaxID=400065 RepID=UPI0026F1811A
IDDTLSLLHHDSLQKATNMLVKASQIVMVSAGDAYEMGETFKNRLLKIGKLVITERRNDNLYFLASVAEVTSCFILISYSGETEQVIKIADKLVERQIPAIVLTSYGDNSLAQRFDTVLHLSTREKLVDNLGNFSSLISISMLLDILYASAFNADREVHYQKRLELSRGFEKRRMSHNPIINDHDV